jgi:hypothetical protein
MSPQPNALNASTWAVSSVCGSDLIVADDLHAATAAAGRRLQDDREADALGGGDGLGRARQHAGAGQHGHAGRLHLLAGADLVAHHLHVDRVGPDEQHAALLHDLGELGPLRQEAVAGVDRVGAGQLGGGDDVLDVEVALGGLAGADAHGLVGEADVQGVLVGGRVHGDGLQAELAARADDPQGDLPAVGDQDLADLDGHSLRTRNSRVPYSTGWALSMSTASITHGNSASSSLNSFIASTMHSVWPRWTVAPTSVNAGDSGLVER